MGHEKKKTKGAIWQLEQRKHAASSLLLCCCDRRRLTESSRWVNASQCALGTMRLGWWTSLHSKYTEATWIEAAFNIIHLAAKRDIIAVNALLFPVCQPGKVLLVGLIMLDLIWNEWCRLPRPRRPVPGWWNSSLISSFHVPLSVLGSCWTAINIYVGICPIPKQCHLIINTRLTYFNFFMCYKTPEIWSEGSWCLEAARCFSPPKSNMLRNGALTASLPSENTTPQHRSISTRRGEKRGGAPSDAPSMSSTYLATCKRRAARKLKDEPKGTTV